MNKFNVGNTMSKMPNSNSVHRMETTGTPKEVHGMDRSIATTRGNPMSDTENVKVIKDSLTKGLYGEGRK